MAVVSRINLPQSYNCVFHERRFFEYRLKMDTRAKMQIERYEIPQKTYRISLAAFFTSFLDLKSIFAISALLHGKKFRSVLKSDVYDKKTQKWI